MLHINESILSVDFTACVQVTIIYAVFLLRYLHLNSFWIIHLEWSNRSHFYYHAIMQEVNQPIQGNNFFWIHDESKNVELGWPVHWILSWNTKTFSRGEILNISVFAIVITTGLEIDLLESSVHGLTSLNRWTEQFIII